ncbi:hypothetical protein CSUI_007183, partial [Cystoisospora suis]
MKTPGLGHWTPRILDFFLLSPSSSIAKQSTRPSSLPNISGVHTPQSTVGVEVPSAAERENNRRENEGENFSFSHRDISNLCPSSSSSLSSSSPLSSFSFSPESCGNEEEDSSFLFSLSTSPSDLWVYRQLLILSLLHLLPSLGSPQLHISVLLHLSSHIFHSEDTSTSSLSPLSSSSSSSFSLRSSTDGNVVKVDSNSLSLSAVDTSPSSSFSSSSVNSVNMHVCERSYHPGVILRLAVQALLLLPISSSSSSFSSFSQVEEKGWSSVYFCLYHWDRQVLYRAARDLFEKGFLSFDKTSSSSFSSSHPYQDLNNPTSTPSSSSPSSSSPSSSSSLCSSHDEDWVGGLTLGSNEDFSSSSSLHPPLSSFLAEVASLSSSSFSSSFLPGLCRSCLSKTEAEEIEEETARCVSFFLSPREAMQLLQALNRYRHSDHRHVPTWIASQRREEEEREDTEKDQVEKKKKEKVKDIKKFQEMNESLSEKEKRDHDTQKEEEEEEEDTFSSSSFSRSSSSSLYLDSSCMKSVPPPFPSPPAVHTPHAHLHSSSSFHSLSFDDWISAIQNLLLRVLTSHAASLGFPEIRGILSALGRQEIKDVVFVHAFIRRVCELMGEIPPTSPSSPSLSSSSLSSSSLVENVSSDEPNKTLSTSHLPSSSSSFLYQERSGGASLGEKARRLRLSEMFNLVTLAMRSEVYDQHLIDALARLIVGDKPPYPSVGSPSSSSMGGLETHRQECRREGEEGTSELCTRSDRFAIEEEDEEKDRVDDPHPNGAQEEREENREREIAELDGGEGGLRQGLVAVGGGEGGGGGSPDVIERVQIGSLINLIQTLGKLQAKTTHSHLFDRMLQTLCDELHRRQSLIHETTGGQTLLGLLRLRYIHPPLVRSLAHKITRTASRYSTQQ